MKLSLDQTTDNSYQQLFSLFRGIALPDMVKQAELDTKESVEKLPTEAFADRYNRAFPIYSAPSTFVSNAYFQSKKASLEKKWGTNYVTTVDDRLKKAAAIFGIEEELASFGSDLEKSASAGPEERVLCTIKDADNNEYDIFPYKTAADLSDAAERFANTLSQYPFSWRTQIADSFVKAASENEVDELPEIVFKYAGQYYPDPIAIVDETKRRLSKIAGKVSQDEKAALLKQAAEVSDIDSALTLCSELYRVEKKAGAYDSRMLRPVLGDVVDRIFVLSPEKVASLLDVIDMAGDTYTVSSLQSVPREIYKQAFGADVDPSDRNQLQDILPTMPLSDVSLFRELSGISPL